jgi:hypothetical protein
MIGALVKNTEWEPLFGLLSPSFFDVVPARTLLAEVRGLASRYLDAEAARSAREFRASALARAGLPFTLVDTLPIGAPLGPDITRGDDVLALYFHQILGEGPTLLDLRRSAFARHEDGWLWSPKPAIALWTDDFRQASRGLYEGYYLDDAAKFSAAAEALGLGAAQAELRAQFGDPGAVSFSLRDFQRRFHAVFQRCKETKSRLHPGFFTFGLGLATLYENLESVGAPLDVRAAFDRVHRSLVATHA